MGLGGAMKKAIVFVFAMALLLGLMACSCRKPPFSVEEQCIQPEDVLTTDRVYDETTNTYIQYEPTEETCIPPGETKEIGLVYIRKQWPGK
jgi:hypothetical protein